MRVGTWQPAWGSATDRRARSPVHELRRSKASTADDSGAESDARTPTRELATGIPRVAGLAFCGRTHPKRTSIRERCGSRRRAMAALRVASRRSRADEILALESPSSYIASDAGPIREAALARRARLPGAQARDRSRSF